MRQSESSTEKVRVPNQRTFSIESHASLVLNFAKQVTEYGSRRPKCFCRYFIGTEIHSLKQASSATTRTAQVFWSVLILSFLFISSYTTKKTLYEYWEDLTSTSYSIKQVDELEFPSVIICPKNPDAFHMEQVRADMDKMIPDLNESDVRALLGYAIADAGFINMDKFAANLTEAEHRKRVKLLGQWRGRRTIADFYKDLFEKFGYTCEELFHKCKLGAERVPCCQIFVQHYVMLRGRCFRLKELYQADPDYHGRLYLNMKQLPSTIIDRSGLQPQVLAYFAPPNAEMATFPRFYLNYRAYHYISASMRSLVLRPDVSSCFPGDERRGKAACYVRRWLYTRFVVPFNCTPFYMNYRAPWLRTCEQGVIARAYSTAIDTSLNGSRCLPACIRSERTFSFYAKEHSIWNPGQNVPDFRLEFGYTDLEYEKYEEILTLTMPGFVSQMGGQLNLFLGITILSVIQFLLSAAMFAINKFRGVKDFRVSAYSQ